MEFEPLDNVGLVSHLRDALARNGVVEEVIASFPHAERGKLEKLPELPPIGDPLKDMVVDIVENKMFLMDYLLSESCESLQTKLALEDEVHEVLELLRPLYVFEKKETNLDTLKQIHTKLPLVIERLSEKVGQDHNCTKEMEFISDRTEVAIWCLENLDLESKWTADTVFELCKNESCNFTLLNQLGVLKTLKEEDARTLLAKQAAAFDFYKHNLAVSRILPFLFKEFRENANDQPVSIKDIERLLKDITSVNLRIRTLHEIYELCFLRKEDAQNNARTEEVNEETKVKSQGAEAALENVNRPPLESPEISAASQVEPASKVSSDVTAYLCRDTKKLKMTLQMLKRQLEMVADAGGYDDDDDRDLALERRKLEQHVNQALWRMELVECDATDGWYTRHLLPNSTSDSWTSQEWLRTLDPDTLSLFGYSRARRKTSQAAKIDPEEDPLIMNRLTADPRSLIIFAIFNSRFTGARQVADFYQLWDTEEGRELRVALTFSTAVKELQRLAKQLCSSGESDELKAIRMASAVETQLSLLQQAAVTQQPDDRQAAIFVADLALAAHDDMAPDIGARLLNFALNWLDEVVDFDAQPWKTFRNYVECFNFQLEQPDRFESPLHSSLPLNVDDRKAFLHQERKRRALLDQAVSSLKGDPETVGRALEALHDGVPPKKAVVWTPSPLLRMKHFFDILRNVLPARLKGSSVEHLMDQDVGEMIFERLQEDPDCFDELETNAKVLGIDLPWFLAARLCYPEKGLKPIDKTDTDFMSRLLAYANIKNTRLAEVVELVLQANYQVALPTLYGTSERLQEGAAIYRRYLEYQAKNKPKIEENAEEVCETAASPSPAPSTPEVLDGSDPIDDIFLELVQDVEIDPVAEMMVALAEVMPEDKREQLNHLLPEPLLAIEQLFMNSQISLATELIKVMRARGSEHDNQAIDRLALQYATIALALGLPDLPSAPAAPAGSTPSKSDKSEGRTPKKKPPNSLAKFAMPLTAPTKDQWVPDAEVSQCPCCETVTFSMFDRRHHCRRCGRVVCAHCSPHRHLVEGYGDVPVRACVDCHAVLQEREEEPDISAVRSASQDGGVSWTLSLDSKHNEIARREFSYEDAPNLALTLSLVHLCQSSEAMANFLLEQSSSTLGTLHRYLIHGKLVDVCSDPNIIFSIVKSLIVSAKMRYSDIIASPDQQHSKAKPARGLARCDALLDQIDLLSLLSTASCLNLLPPQPLSQKDTWRKLRDRLIEVELWSLALDVSTKAGLDSETVWAAWGLVFLRAGNFKGARQRFQRCLKPGKVSPLLQEIVQVLERLAVPTSLVPDLTKRARRVSSSSPTSHPLFDTDAPQLIAVRLARLNDIAAGRLPEMEDKHYLLPEVLYYLETYGAPEASYVHLVEKSQRIDTAVSRFALANPAPDVFNHGLLVPCLKAGKLEDLFVEMKRHDASFQTWKKYLLAGAQLLESKGYWNSLYQLHCLSGDWIRASLVAVRRLYLGDLCSIETLITRSHLLKDVIAHLGTYLARQASLAPAPATESEGESQLPLWWPANEVANLQNTVRHQLKVTSFIDACSRAGKVTLALIKEVKTATQASEASESGSVNSYLVPTLLGSRQFRQSCAVLVTCAGQDAAAFELSWQICGDYRVRLDRYFRQSSFVMIRLGLIQSLIEFVEFVKGRMTEQSVGYFDMDELLVECATLIQERDKETRTPDTELILQLIKRPVHKTRALINVGWLKAAYLLAVKGGQVADVIHIKQEAVRLQQPAVLALCDKWLRARNVK